MRVIDADGQQAGVMSAREALRLAEERELDLVEVAPNSVPPVCKIMDFGKYKYELAKKHTARKTIEVKEVKVRPQISDHDLELKARNVKRFLDEGNKAKVSMILRLRPSISAVSSDGCAASLIAVAPGRPRPALPCRPCRLPRPAYPRDRT